MGVDVGGTKIATGVCDAQGRVVSRNVSPTRPGEGVSAVIDRMVFSVHQAAAGAGIRPDELQGIGMCCPGTVDPASGRVIVAPNLGWTGIDAVAPFIEAFGLPVFLENDANVAALAELRFGAGRGSRFLIYITVSTGVGGGVIADGKIYHGAHFAAGEIGHTLVVSEGGRLCGCGRHGCLEAYASGTAIASRAVEALRGGGSSLVLELAGRDLSRVSSSLVAEAARQGDSLALSVLAEAVHFLGVGVTNLLNLFDPEVVVIGGGVSRLGDALFEPLRRAVREKALPPASVTARIVPAELKEDVGIIGAASLVFDGR